MLLASRGIMAVRCPEMTPLLYSREGGTEGVVLHVVSSVVLVWVPIIRFSFSKRLIKNKFSFSFGLPD